MSRLSCNAKREIEAMTATVIEAVMAITRIFTRCIFESYSLKNWCRILLVQKKWIVQEIVCYVFQFWTHCAYFSIDTCSISDNFVPLKKVSSVICIPLSKDDMGLKIT